MKNTISNYLTLLIVFVTFIIIIAGYFKTDSPFNIYSVIGLIIMIPSLVLFTISRIQLGRSFQVSAKANDLVTEGVYKKIRHPVYFFGLIFILGVIVFIQVFYLLIIWAGLIYMQTIRIKKEEKVLEGKFGEQYINYKKETWF